jgi:hypothetical protein
LPPPAEAEFEEVRSALRAIEGIRTDFADLNAELSILGAVIDKLQEARRETEKIARYAYVGAELDRREAVKALEEAGTWAKTAHDAAEKAERRKKAAGADVTAKEAALRVLRATEGAALLEREEEVRRDLAAAQEEFNRAKAELADQQGEFDRASDAAAKGLAALNAMKARAGVALLSVADVAREYVGQPAVVTATQLADLVAEQDPHLVPRRRELEEPWGHLRRRLEKAHGAAAGQATLLEADAKRLAAEANDATREADEVRRRAEVLPDLPGYDRLLADLPAVADQAVPLYRLFALAPGTPESLGAGLECLLGARILGAIAVPLEQHAAARAHVLAHGGGVEVIDPAECTPAKASPTSGTPAWRTLPAILADAEPSALAYAARAFLERVAGDVRILEAGESRGDARRAVWTDGHLFELGAEARIDAAAPRFLGPDARARAAAEEEARLRLRADQLAMDARQAKEKAEVLRSAVKAVGAALDKLVECTPASLLAAVEAARVARGRLSERQAVVERVSGRVERQADVVSKLKSRHEKILAAVASAGIADLRERITQLEQELGDARENEKKEIEKASAARTEADERAHDQKLAEEALHAAEGAARARRESLEPLVDPKHRAELDDYVFRLMRGAQIRAENVTDLVSEADRARARAFQWLDSSDGIRNQRLWQKYAFRLNEADRDIRDQAGRPVEEVYEQREAEVTGLEKALDERTRDLLERVVMAGLVRSLQGQVRDLNDTIQGINRLAADLRFGTSRFEFSLRNRPEFHRLLELLREQSILQPALREELRERCRPTCSSSLLLRCSTIAPRRGFESSCSMKPFSESMPGAAKCSCSSRTVSASILSWRHLSSTA